MVSMPGTLKSINLLITDPKKDELDYPKPKMETNWFARVKKALEEATKEVEKNYPTFPKPEVKQVYQGGHPQKKVRLLK